MGTSKNLVVALFTGAILFTSCNVNDDIIDSNKQLEVKFTSDITATVETKAAIDAAGNSLWETGDPIGIYMVGNGGITVVEGAENVKYTASVSGASTSFVTGGSTIYYPVNTPNKVDFIAYHPHRTTVTNWVYPVNVTTQTPQTNIDLMWATADNAGAGYDKMNNLAVNFVFHHQLVKLVMNITKGAGATGTISSVTIKGMNTTATFDLTGAGGLTGIASPASITPYTTTTDSKYEAILLPVATLGASHTVEFTIGTETYVWPMANDISDLAAGSIYIYDITLTRYAVNVTGRIGSWTVGSTGSGTAE